MKLPNLTDNEFDDIGVYFQNIQQRINIYN